MRVGVIDMKKKKMLVVPGFCCAGIQIPTKRQNVKDVLREEAIESEKEFELSPQTKKLLNLKVKPRPTRRVNRKR